MAETNKEFELEVKKPLTTITVNRQMAEKIIKTQVLEHLWESIVPVKMYMSILDLVQTLRIEYYIKDDLHKRTIEDLEDMEDEEMTYEEDLAIRMGNINSLKDSFLYHKYFIEIDGECNAAEHSGYGIFLLPFISLLMREGFIGQIK